MKYSTYYFHKKTKILADFQICISVPLSIFTECEKLETQSKHINRKESNIDHHDLVKLRKDYENNPIIGYFNINHLASKIDYLKETCSKSPIDILCVDETKLDFSHPDVQFEIPGYQYPPFRKDSNKNGGSKVVFTRDSLITERLKAFQGDMSRSHKIYKRLVHNLCLSTSI